VGTGRDRHRGGHLVRPPPRRIWTSAAA
jgi:hypothetical protein